MKKLNNRILIPTSAGFFTQEEAEARAMRLVTGKQAAEDIVVLYWLVDLEDGIIADAKFQVFGHHLLIAAADIACELLLRKNYDQARRITAELIEKQVQGKAFPKESYKYLNMIIDAIDEAASKCTDIPFADTYVAPPMPTGAQESSEYPGWNELKEEHKISVIEQVIASDIRPYIELDAGGVQILRLEGNGVVIGYEGACTTCYSSTGATLNAIQQILQTKVHPSIIVIPDLSFLKAKE